MLTQSKLKDKLRYSPSMGTFTWRKTEKIAGCKDRNGYIKIQIDNKRYPAHRLVWLYLYGEWPKKEIDHINHNRDDNRQYNLRDVSKTENQRNRSMSKNNTSGYSGIYWHKRDKSWRVVLYINNKNTYIGQRKLLDDAIAVLKKALKEHNFHSNHGKLREFTRSN